MLTIQEIKEGKAVNADLRGANLYGANLYGADLRGADLRGADLTSANLYGADLRGADLRGADLTSANLYLYGADLRGADLRGADLYDADLTGANLTGAKLNETTTMPNGETWQDYLSIVVPELLTAKGKTIAECAKHWDCHTWDNCPMAIAFSVSTIEETPVLLRSRIIEFVQYFDAKLIPNPLGILQ